MHDQEVRWFSGFAAFVASVAFVGGMFVGAWAHGLNGTSGLIVISVPVLLNGAIAWWRRA